MRTLRLTLFSCTALACMAMPLPAQTFDVSVPPGENFDTAEFRLWHPESVEALRGILVLVPGSNGDGRAGVEDSTWRDLANKHDLALLGVHMTDKRHSQMFIEHYVDVEKGSGAAFLEAVDRFADASGHPELSYAPLLLWGMSAGGQFNYEFALWKPERVLAFIVNKGGIYYSAQASEEETENWLFQSASPGTVTPPREISSLTAKGGIDHAGSFTGLGPTPRKPHHFPHPGREGTGVALPSHGGSPGGGDPHHR